MMQTYLECGSSCIIPGLLVFTAIPSVGKTFLCQID